MSRFSDGRTFGVRRVEIPPQPERALPCDMKGIIYEGKDVTPPLVPNAETIKALKAAERGELKTFATIDELFADLNSKPKRTAEKEQKK